MSAILRILPLALLLVSVTSGCAQFGPATVVESSEGGFSIVLPDEIRWQNIPGGLGAQVANIYGDPSKPGLYVVRVRFPPHVMDLPHSHSEDRHVTVIKGIWFAGTGVMFDPSKATQLKAGSYMFHPAEAVHWDGAASDEEAIVQIIGRGPVTTIQNHGPEPDWVEVK